MSRYSNRSVTPSYLSSTYMGGTSRSPMFSDTTQLLLGEVKEIIPPTDNRSMSKKYLEYNVEVQHKDGPGAFTVVTFTNCLLMNSLAAVADKHHYTLRADKSTPAPDRGTTTGAKVLVLCLGGNASSAFIIGGIREDLTPDANDHHYFFEFNGIQATINKDGELQLKYRGATKINGDLTDAADPKASDSYATFTKDGSIKLATQDDAQFIHINHADKKLEVLADEEWKVTVNKKITIDAGDDINVTGNKVCDVEIKDNVIIKSAGVLVGDATDHWLLADTYRNAEGTMDKKLSGMLNTLQSLISTAAISLNAAAGVNAIPIVGGGIASPMFIAAATALSSAAPLFAQMASAIDAFESGADSFLSKKNLND